MCPEALFNPSLLGMNIPGIHELIYSSLMKCDIDLRKDLYCNIIVSGGNTMCEGFVDRLKKEMSALVPGKLITRIVFPPERKYSVWIGGSIVASFINFSKVMGL